MKILRLSLIILLMPCLGAVAQVFPPFTAPVACQPRDEAIVATTMRELIEDDWLQSAKPGLTTQSDAAGACNGVKDGTYGFHVGHQAHPWWQVDLGEMRQVGRIRVYNRLDYPPGLHNADALQMLYSEDGQDWRLCHDNQGRHFGGIHGAPPLDVRFDGDGLSTRFIRIALPSDAPIFLHLDEVEVYATGDDETNIALRQPADQSSLSPWSTPKVVGPREYAIESWIKRGYRLAARLAHEGVDVSADIRNLDAVAEQYRLLPEDAEEEARSALFIETRWAVRRIVFKNPLLDFDRLLFMKRFTQETFPDVCLNHMPWVSRPGGDLCILSPVSEGEGLFAALADPHTANDNTSMATVTHLLNGALGPGRVHDMDLWFEGDRIVFGYARTRTNDPPEGWLDRSQSYRLRREEQPTHLFELHLDARQVRQITDGEWSDLDPTYAPNGNIVFVSERCGTSLQCNEYDKDETSCNLYVVRPDGGGIRRLTVNKDGDYLPRALDNGLIGYTRWEYQERSFAYIQSLWTIRPNGTGADALFKQHLQDPWALVEVRSIPGSNKLTAIATGHHTLSVGPLVVIDYSMGVNEPQGISIVTPTLTPPQGGMSGVPVPEGGTTDHDGFYGTPWALSEQFFLAAYAYGNEMTTPTGYGLYLVDVYGNRELVYRDPDISCFSPVPLRPRPIPHILPDAMDMQTDHAACYVTDITYGADGIEPGQARYLRISEPIGWPYTIEDGGLRFGEDHRYGGPDEARRNLTNWTPVRILGDVHVNEDGSAQFTVPADTAVYFQLLDENRMELRRMRSFISFQPGEVRGCVGCHETRRDVAALQPRETLPLSLLEEPTPKLMAPWGDEPINFLRDVQPVLDGHCTRCHGGLEPKGGLDFVGGLIAWDREVPHYAHNRAYETILKHNLVSMSPARAQDAGITPPMAYGSHKSKLLTAMTKEQHKNEVTLSEDDQLRLAMWIDANAPYHDQFVNKRSDTPVYCVASDEQLLEEIIQVHERRCAACHAPDVVSRLDWVELKAPETSRFLMAPLAASAGGAQQCGESVYADRQDPDYAHIRALIEAAAARAWEHPRRDLVSLIPTTLRSE